MKTVTYTIPNISCGHCVHTIKTEVGEIAGVKSVEADLKVRKSPSISIDPANEEQIIDLLKEINYPPN